jgi:REP element-mobilizing transposase RayT
VRLQDHDYTEDGVYFVTLCTHNRIKLFGSITNACISLSVAGLIAQACWLSIPQHFTHVDLDALVIMPNHIHGILVLLDQRKPSVGATHGSPAGVLTAGSVGAIVGQF